MKINFYFHNCWGDFKQIALIPTIYITRSKPFKWWPSKTVISINVLIWDLGVIINAKKKPLKKKQ